MNNVQDIDFSTGLLCNFCRKIESTKETFKINFFYKVKEMVAISFLGYFFLEIIFRIFSNILIHFSKYMGLYQISGFVSDYLGWPLVDDTLDTIKIVVNTKTLGLPQQ